MVEILQVLLLLRAFVYHGCEGKYLFMSSFHRADVIP